MGAAASIILELEDALQRGSRHKRAETLRRVTALFLGAVPRYGDAHLALFDDVFVLLIDEIESHARAELAQRLAPVGNAPPKVLRLLANDDDIAVAGPVLSLAPRLDAADLVALAKTKSQAHLEAIARRQALDETVTDILLRRGDREVARGVAGNRGARISENGFARLAKRAESDGILAEKVGLRPDIPPHIFHELLMQATAIVHRRLIAAAPPELKAEIHRILEKVSNDVGARIGPRDYREAQRVVLRLHRAGGMNKAALAAFASDNKYDETVVSLAALSKVPIAVADRLMAGERPDPVLILCKAAGMSWPTVKSVITAHPDGRPSSTLALDAAFANYERLSPSTAQRVVRFWQVQRSA